MIVQKEDSKTIKFRVNDDPLGRDEASIISASRKWHSKMIKESNINI